MQLKLTHSARLNITLKGSRPRTAHMAIQVGRAQIETLTQARKKASNSHIKGQVANLYSTALLLSTQVKVENSTNESEIPKTSQN